MKWVMTTHRRKMIATLGFVALSVALSTVFMGIMIVFDSQLPQDGGDTSPGTSQLRGERDGFLIFMVILMLLLFLTSMWYLLREWDD